MSRPIDSSFFQPAALLSLKAALLTASLICCIPAHAGSAPNVSSPTCVKWCGNDAPSGRTTSKPRSSPAPVPVIDVGSMMDATRARIKKNQQSNLEAAKAADAIRLKQEAQQRAAAQAQQSAERIEIQKLSGELKGGVTMEAPNNITLKPIPPASGLARSQLDCAANIKPDINHSNPGEESWQSHAGGCTPVTPNVPEPPQPTRVENQADQLAKLLDSLMQQISTKREKLTQQDSEIASKEQEVAQEQLKIVNPGKGESDALRRAREALEKARADRARTADELAKLEHQEQTARDKTPPPQ
ncbi:MAG: hypothetical protein NTY60_00440 [Proteobacteria bacterium]|nr:hypothetical protein [Pseudomonadota bacterium]